MEMENPMLIHILQFSESYLLQRVWNCNILFNESMNGNKEVLKVNLDGQKI